MDVQSKIDRLAALLSFADGALRKIDEEAFRFKESELKWSKKEIIGHLIDSAANNHQRFIRAQYLESPVVFYDQDKWNALSYYNELPSELVINLFISYNRHLLHIVGHIPAESLSNRVYNGSDSQVTLGFVVSDYVDHLEHHLRSVIQL